MKSAADKAQEAERQVRVCNKRGLHARASAKFVRLAESFPCQITVAKDDIEVAGTSIMGLLLLAAAEGEVLILRAIGEQAGEALDGLEELIGGGFDEAS